MGHSSIILYLWACFMGKVLCEDSCYAQSDYLREGQTYHSPISACAGSPLFPLAGPRAASCCRGEAAPCDDSIRLLLRLLKHLQGVQQPRAHRAHRAEWQA